MGMHHRLGAGSQVRNAFFSSAICEPKLTDLCFQYADIDADDSISKKLN